MFLRKITFFVKKFRLEIQANNTLMHSFVLETISLVDVRDPGQIRTKNLEAKGRKRGERKSDIGLLESILAGTEQRGKRERESERWRKEVTYDIVRRCRWNVSHPTFTVVFAKKGFCATVRISFSWYFSLHSVASSRTEFYSLTVSTSPNPTSLIQALIPPVRTTPWLCSFGIPDSFNLSWYQAAVLGPLPEDDWQWKMTCLYLVWTQDQQTRISYWTKRCTGGRESQLTKTK